jgi:hypothetical protein
MDTTDIGPEPKSMLLGFGGLGNSFGDSRNVNRNKNGQFSRAKKPKVQTASTKAEITPITVKIEGARLIDIQHLQNQMICQKCGSELSIRGIVSETNLGLASVLSVLCSCCKKVRKVQTSKRNADGKYNINISAVIGKIFAWKYSN